MSQEERRVLSFFTRVNFSPSTFTGGPVNEIVLLCYLFQLGRYVFSPEEDCVSCNDVTILRGSQLIEYAIYDTQKEREREGRVYILCRALYTHVHIREKPRLYLVSPNK